MQSETFYLAEGAFVTVNEAKTVGLKMIHWIENGFELSSLTQRQLADLDWRDSERAAMSLYAWHELFSDSGLDPSKMIKSMLLDLYGQLETVTDENAWYAQAWTLQLSLDLDETEKSMFTTLLDLQDELHRLIDLAIKVDWKHASNSTRLI
ncbi:Hypothetical protein POVR2_LOCUS391 [uncultured virus]|nr:Hypothetical protein POVR2_LOCUS391 [uncultured virus]